MNVLYGSFITLLGFIFKLTCQLGRGILFARILGPQGRGVMGLITSHNVTSTSLGSLGIGQSLIFFHGRKLISSYEGVAFSLFFGFLIGIVTVAGGGIFFFIFEKTIFKDVSRTFILFSFFSIPVTLA
jgi:hypothetical protein